MNIKLVAGKGGRTRTRSVLLALSALAILAIAVVPASASAATKTKPRPVPVLAQGVGMGAAPSTAVRRVQRVLERQGYDLGAPGVDGRFGPLTDAAVRRLQSDYGLAADGVVGPKTHKLVRLIQRRSQQASSSRGQSSPKQQKTTRPKPGSAKQPAAQATPAPTRTTVLPSQSNDTDWLLAILASACVGVLCAAFAALALRWNRSRRAVAPILAPINRELFLEGRSEDERVGEFRGQALVTRLYAIPGEQDEPGKTSYLVDDVRKSAPVWVHGEEVKRRTSGLAAGEAVIGYVTLSPDAQPSDADVPVHAIEAACERSDWELIEVVTDRENGVSSLERPGLSRALEQIADGQARGLVVSDLRRLSRSIVDLGALVEWFRDAQAALVALDLGIDTSTPSGHELAATLVKLSGWERERVARRARSGLAAVPAPAKPGGRAAVADRPALLERINAMRAANMTLQAIADKLNAEGVPTMRGGQMWRPSSVQAALGYKRPGTRANARNELPSLEDREA
jgi:DNA invertase Pin-like site-specific DNA recombinase/peptidoglycan hydrolase-like protein with peptidoglycan-binding domain